MSLPARIGLVGYGRFGAALGGLLAAHGFEWCAFDPHPTVPEPHAAASLQALADAAELILLAVPVPALDAVLSELRPWLRAGQRVADVGSVKVEPCALLARHLGAEIAHCGSHPLFGPISIERGEPLRCIVCPSEGHSVAADEVAALFTALGCAVRRMSPSAHDALMADTHALAFFVARALLDLGLDRQMPWAPPSFAALRSTLAAVQGDAGHLFEVIERRNPFAAGARERLLEALMAVHHALEGPDRPPAG